MNSGFPRTLLECRHSVVPANCVQYGIAPSGGHVQSHHHPHPHRPAGGQGDPLAHVPFLLYPANVDPGYYDASYPGALFPYVPFHGHFGVYECPFEPAFIQKRNERERQRVKCVNEGYARLRGHLPGAESEKRLSKVETLRAAIQYIKYLQELVSRTPTRGLGREPEAEEQNSKASRNTRANSTEPLPNSDGESQNLSSASSSPFCESEESVN
ncbi:achaete-scute homolog 5-like [Polyodon spathula]|uniref:achaete-scute homolog 5-like n=1 Tax=Polyodon spathula TaxID=7913 RepID=UPI001B7EE4EC|nr:achaete-scute homolog 5-like [Polyodon spathula]